jgi:hypothetical protein
MSTDNLSLSNRVDRRRSSDDAHLLIGRALGETIRRENRTESYVTIPDALYIVDDDGAVFTLGFTYIEVGWRFEYIVLRNDVPTGQFAERIEYTRRAGHSGTIRFFGKDGVRIFSRNKSCFI